MRIEVMRTDSGNMGSRGHWHRHKCCTISISANGNSQLHNLLFSNRNSVLLITRHVAGELVTWLAINVWMVMTSY